MSWLDVFQAVVAGLALLLAVIFVLCVRRNEMNEGFTPGPWKTGREDMQSFDGNGEPFTNIYHATEKDGTHLGEALPLTIAKVFGSYKLDDKANARLIAAAPDLLEALKRVSDEIDRNDYDGGISLAALNQLAAAIAKAEA